MKKVLEPNKAWNRCHEQFPCTSCNMSHEIVMWIATLDNTKRLPTSNWYKGYLTLAPIEISWKVWRAGEQKPGNTSLLRNEVARPTQHARFLPIRAQKGIYNLVLFTIHPALLSYYSRALHKATCLTVHHIALKITRLTKKQINRRKGNKRTIWTFKSLLR